MSNNEQIDEKSLTAMEEEIMVIVWKIGECSVHDVLEALPEDRALAYTSVSSVLRNLEKKNFVQPRKRGRNHLYSAVVSRTRFGARKLRSLFSEVFQGRPRELVRALVDETDLTAKEIHEIAKLIDGPDHGDES